MATFETMDGVSYEELFAGPETEVLTKNVTVTTGASFVRGQLLTASTAGTYAATATGETASAIAAEAVTSAAEGTIATVYITGRFNAPKLTVADGDDAFNHEEELRGKGIFLAPMKTN